MNKLHNSTKSTTHPEYTHENITKFKFNLTEYDLKKLNNFRITFESKIKTHDCINMLGYVVKITKSNEQLVWEIVYRSEFYNIQNINPNDLLENIQKEHSNTIDVLENYINNFESYWYINVKQIIGTSACVSKLIFTTNPNNIIYSK